MPRKCCVPGCKSNYESTIKTEGSVSTFKLPRDDDRRKAWICSIPRENWNPTTNTAVCIKHFDESDVVQYEIYRQPDGTTTKLRLMCPKLTLQAVPCIFPPPPYNLSSQKAAKRTESKKRKTILKKQEEKSIQKENLIKEEPIEDFGQYNREEKFGVLGNFYQVECNAGPAEYMEEGEEQLEEDVLQRNGKGCACSKDLERLESRLGRLECLLELLVSKVASTPDAASPSPAPISPSPTVSEEVDRGSVTSINGGGEGVQISTGECFQMDPFKATTPVPYVILTKPGYSILREQTKESKEGNDLTSVDEKSNLPPLVKAAEVGNLSELELLLKNHPPPKQVAEALLRTGCASVVKLIYEAYPEVVRGPEGSRALYLAAECGRVTVLCALLDAGLDPNTASRSTMTVLQKAASKGHVDCVRALLERGADVSLTNNCKWSALHVAAMNGTTDCMPVLVKAGAEIEAQDKTGCTPLHYAARWNHVGAVNWLLKNGASQNTKNIRGKTPLDLTNGGEILKLLTRNSKSVSREDKPQLKVKRLKNSK